MLARTYHYSFVAFDLVDKVGIAAVVYNRLVVSLKYQLEKRLVVMASEIVFDFVVVLVIAKHLMAFVSCFHMNLIEVLTSEVLVYNYSFVVDIVAIVVVVVVVVVLYNSSSFVVAGVAVHNNDHLSLNVYPILHLYHCLTLYHYHVSI
jgi:hypothetical protein